MSPTKAAVNSFDECNVCEKAAQLSVIVCDNKLSSSNDEAFSLNTVCYCRYRYDKFVYFNRPHTNGIRDSKPSRIPKKRIKRILKKSWRVRRLLRTYIRKSIPKSVRVSFVHSIFDRSLPECIFLQIKLVKKYMHMESDVRIREQRNIPLLQLGETIESLRYTGY